VLQGPISEARRVESSGHRPDPPADLDRARPPLIPARTLTHMSWGHFILLFSPSFLALIIGFVIVGRAGLLRRSGVPEKDPRIVRLVWALVGVGALGLLVQFLVLGPP
jgi:hypothetical protein